jgi:hypothetical protein
VFYFGLSTKSLEFKHVMNGYGYKLADSTGSIPYYMAPEVWGNRRMIKKRTCLALILVETCGSTHSRCFLEDLSMEDRGHVESIDATESIVEFK